LDFLGPLELRLKEAIERNNTVAKEDVGRALHAAELAGQRLDTTLVELGFLSELQLFDILSTELGVREFTLPPSISITPIDKLPPSYLAEVNVIPLSTSNETVALGMVNPFDDLAVACIELKTGLNATRVRLSPSTFSELWKSAYGEHVNAALTEHIAPAVAASVSDLAMLRDSASEAPVVRFVQNAIRRSVEMGASDIHLRPLGHKAEMLFRVDGELIAQLPPDGAMLAAVISRLKIMAGLDISERRLPQDGKIRTNIAGRAIDIRMSTLALADGEGVVLRLLSRELTRASLSDLGFSQAISIGLEQSLHNHDGLLLVTGPTGSGKSTTLHAMMRRIWRPELSIVSIEDPVEYRSEGISQIEVDEKIGLTFPKILRSVLRHDPDVIMVGEIRDAETAAIAVQAALTGHLVLATLHTNSALAAIPRLVDMGVEPYMLAAVLRGVLAQRLLKRRCAACDNGAAEDGSPCASCNGTGAKGRVAVGEFARLEPVLVEALATTAEVSEELRHQLGLTGYVPLQHDLDVRRRSGEIYRDGEAGDLR